MRSTSKISRGHFVSRGGEKLAAALDAFGVNVKGLVSADLGSHVGGFVDCLLRRGARKAYSVDTSYGTLAWTLRKDPRVIVLERTNAMHVALPEPVDLVTIDVGWTPQGKIIPHAATLLKIGGTLLSLIKPHYEANPSELVQGVLPDDRGRRIVDEIIQQIPCSELEFHGVAISPIRGHGGNQEYFLHMIKVQ